MLLSTRIKIVLALWFTLEAVVFVLVAEVIGYPEALLIAFVTTLFGWTLLRRAGASAMTKLRAVLEGRVEDQEKPRFLDDGLAGLGAVALLTPGFVSDAIGLALAVPAARDRVSRWLGRRPLSGFAKARPQAGPSTIDLDPQEWQRNEGSHKSPLSKV